LIAAAAIVSLSRYRKKGEPGEQLTEMQLLEGLGVDGDYHQGGERQVSLFSAEARLWMETQTIKGLCFGRFRENILTEGLALEDLESGGFLSVGDAVLLIGMRGKHCYDECRLFSKFSKGKPCRLSGCAVFAAVERGGTIRIGDPVFPVSFSARSTV
jgi:cyclic pyranopterin phosphate synthase